YLRFKSTFVERKIKTQIVLPNELALAQVDEEVFTKIISNLLNNALKYAKSKVIITLSVHESVPVKFFIEIRNDGNLIPPAMKEKIFEPFYRLKTGNHSGTGLGLPLARSLAELHNGSLDLKLNADEMNVFLFILPQKSENKPKNKV